MVDDILASIATRVLANAETGYVYRLRPECWPEVDVHSICIRTRKQQHDVEQQLFQHAKANPTLYIRPAAGDIYMCVCVCVYIYAYIHAHTHTYVWHTCSLFTHMHIYIYIMCYYI